MKLSRRELIKLGLLACGGAAGCGASGGVNQGPTTFDGERSNILEGGRFPPHLDRRQQSLDITLRWLAAGERLGRAHSPLKKKSRWLSAGARPVRRFDV
ncbi:MAG TPA: hypothetical protein VNO55_32800 [Polyangia bacterium]|nr:hypothetical protein [Polyangia bacterium]